MSKPYPEEVTESLRLHILRSLVELNHTANDSVLLNRADKFGFCFSRDRFRKELRWMERNGLIEFTKIEDSDCYRVELLAYGDDVCHGRERLEGVQNPMLRR
ncbi:ArsR family transcriptional regulator [Maridesulfovibrio sp.]|uniref:VpaChn25_0724 family phage protein n=1 Tax=Maridesulfovibrio sp. TaxID=2795000 RepID=UPI0039EDE8EA